MLGEVFNGRYRVDSLIGEGGIGKVYAAQHLTLGRQVALKVLLEEHENTPKLRKRFEREAKVLSGLNHPHIISITDVGVTDEGMPYLVMELLEGTTLSHYLRTHEVGPEQAVAITSQLLSAMAYAHGQGIAHRDLKPQNMFVQPLSDGSVHVTVLDFGLVRFLDEGLRKGTKLTRKGAVLGTPAYMAPEQAAGGEADERADVYAAGLIFYEMLAGRRPFTSKDAGELRRAHLTEPPPRLGQADPGLEVHDALEEFMERALAKDAADRFADAASMRAALDALPEGAARRVSPLRRQVADEPSTPDAIADTLAASPESRPIPRTRVGQPEVGASRTAQPAPKIGSPPQLQAAVQPTPRVWFYVAGALAAVSFVVVGGLAAGLVLHFSGADDAAPPAHAKPHSAVVHGSRASITPSSSAPLADLPPELARLHHALATGHGLSRRDAGILSRWSRAHPSDPRSRLLLGRHYTASRSLSWALPQYREALAIDVSVRAWSPMLEDLLEIACSRSHSLAHPAADLIVQTYGSEAIHAAEAQLEGTHRRDEERRLEALLVRLNATR